MFSRPMSSSIDLEGILLLAMQIVPTGSASCRYGVLTDIEITFRCTSTPNILCVTIKSLSAEAAWCLNGTTEQVPSPRGLRRP